MEKIFFEKTVFRSPSKNHVKLAEWMEPMSRLKIFTIGGEQAIRWMKGRKLVWNKIELFEEVWR